MGKTKSRDVLQSSALLPKIPYYLVLLSTTVLISSGILMVYFILILKYYHFVTEVVTINVLMVLFQLLVHLYYVSVLNINRYHELSMEKEEMQIRQLELELESFKTEMNPGLLMECLESLLTLIKKDVQESENYIHTLSNQYRFMLDSRKKEFINLNEELQSVRELVYLLSSGGKPRIELEFESKDDSVQVIPGTLHNIIYNVENTMILSTIDPLIIKISLDDQNNICLKHPNQPKLVPGSTVNMDKVKQSYLHYTDRGIDNRVKGKWLEWLIPSLPEIIN